MVNALLAPHIVEAVSSSAMSSAAAAAAKAARDSEKKALEERGDELGDVRKTSPLKSQFNLRFAS